MRIEFITAFVIFCHQRRETRVIQKTKKETEHMKKNVKKAQRPRKKKVWKFNAQISGLTAEDVRFISEEAYQLMMGNTVDIKRF